MGPGQSLYVLDQTHPLLQVFEHTGTVLAINLEIIILAQNNNPTFGHRAPYKLTSAGYFLIVMLIWNGKKLLVNCLS